MPTIALTHFVDFVSKARAPKMIVAKNAKQQLADGYDPATESCKPICDGIIDFQRKDTPKDALDALLTRRAWARSIGGD